MLFPILERIYSEITENKENIVIWEIRSPQWKCYILIDSSKRTQISSFKRGLRNEGSINREMAMRNEGSQIEGGGNSK